MSPLFLLLAMVCTSQLPMVRTKPSQASMVLALGLLALVDQIAHALAAFLAEFLVTLVTQLVLARLAALAAGLADGHVTLVLIVLAHEWMAPCCRATRSRRSPSSRLAGRRS